MPVPQSMLDGRVSEIEMPVMAAGLVTPSSAQVRLTVLGVEPTGTRTLLPQLDAQVPQLLGPPAESVVGLVVPGSLTDRLMPAEPASPTAGPASPHTVNEMPV